jgi:hypothetical protein
MLTSIPLPLTNIVGDALGFHYFHHRTLETLFYEAGASGEVPEGNCTTKVTNWLVREGKADVAGALLILGKILEEFMDGEAPRNSTDWVAEKAKVERVLARYGLRYERGGRIFGTTVAAPSKDLAAKLRDLSFEAAEEEFDRAYRSVAADPPAAITAACAIVETLCKQYLADHAIDLPAKQTIQPLWKLVAKELKLSPDAVEDDDLKRILGGLSSIVDGVGSLRTHVGSAHGHVKRSYKVEPRHARVSVHAAHTLCMFMLEVMSAKVGKSRRTTPP